MLKNTFATICLLLTTFLLVNAQVTGFGLRLGPSFTTLGGDDGDSYNFVLGYHVGVYANIPFNEKISFEPGIQLATKGAGSSFIGSNAISRTRNTYLDIPLLLKFDTNNSFFYFVGAQPSVLLSSAVIIRENGNKVSFDGPDIRELFKGFDFAGIIGFGFHLGKGINSQLSYEHGFSNISDVGGVNYNRGVKLSLGKTF
jgi:hypothetical protein